MSCNKSMYEKVYDIKDSLEELLSSCSAVNPELELNLEDYKALDFAASKLIANLEGSPDRIHEKMRVPKIRKAQFKIQEIIKNEGFK